MKLGQQLKTLVTKKGRIFLDITGGKWDVLDQLSDKLSGLTGRRIDIEHEGDCTFNIYVNEEHKAWVDDGLTPYEIYLLEEALQKFIEDKGYKIQLAEA